MPKYISRKTYVSPLGSLELGVWEDKICLCDWSYRSKRTEIDTRISEGLEAQFLEADHPLHLELIHQLEAYFKGKLKTFDLPMQWVGTSFQKDVWKLLEGIPYGSYRSYLQLAQQLENAGAVRAVAAANGANAHAILLPCHRVIGTSGALTGYAGGVATKKKLLEIEGRALQTSLF